MRRRELLGLLGSAAVWPLAASAQQPGRVHRVGYVFSFVPSEGQHLWEACRQGLRDLGYVEGQNILLEPRWADGHHERLPDIVAELVRLKVDAIVTAATPASRAAKAATGAIPIVFVAVADPTRVGLVASLARPGGNATGLSLLTPELSGKRLQIITEIANPARIGVLTNPDNLSHAVFLDETMISAQGGRLQIQPLHARNSLEIERAFLEASRLSLQAIVVFDDPVIWSLRKRVVALAAKAELPAMYGYSEFVSEGGLISYGPHRPDLYRRTAVYVDKLLKGAKPADLPVERPTRFELFVNLKTARSLGLAVPGPLLAGADEVIE
jgi:putative ABC transport system substrate-binding protein